MTHFKTVTVMTVASLMAFAATPSFAQDTDMIKDKAVDMAKDKAKDVAVDKAGTMGGAAVDMGAGMAKGKSMKDAAKGVAMDAGKAEMKSATGMDGMTTGAVIGGAGALNSSMTTDEKIKAGKVMMKGGSAEDAAMAVAKDRAKDKMMDTARDMVSGQTAPMAPAPAANPVAAPTAASVAAPAPMAAPVNCPAGTTGQPDGTCMITGDYNGK